jgi:hypothetical protein
MSPPNEYDLMQAAASQSPAHAETSDRRSSGSEQLPFDIEGRSKYTETVEQTASPGTRYVQHVSLPRQMPDDSTYMYSAVHPSEFEENEVSDLPPRKIMPGSLYDGMNDHYSHALDNNGYDAASMMSQGGQKVVYLTEPMKEGHNMDASSKSDYYYEEDPSYIERDTSYSPPSDGKAGLGKFFGLTGTTSQNIQVTLLIVYHRKYIDFNAAALHICIIFIFSITIMHLFLCSLD